MAPTFGLSSHPGSDAPPPMSDPDRDELVRWQFRCATLERLVDNQSALKAAAASFEAEAEQLARELRAARAAREQLIAALRSAADLSRRSLDQILALDGERPGLLAGSDHA